MLPSKYNLTGVCEGSKSYTRCIKSGHLLNNKYRKSMIINAFVSGIVLAN
jgi:hypothetical protein